MAFTNSKLVNYTKISPNRNSPRNQPITTITIHCTVGQCSVETLGSIFAQRSKAASSNYGIGPDGRIGMYVEEKDRSWCSSNAANDNRAVTIEVASDTKHPYAVKKAAFESLIKLVADICERNGIEKLVWSTNKSDRVNHRNGCNMTVHRDYANKSCPGQYLYDRHGEIAERVNAILAANRKEEKADTPTPAKTATTELKIGDVITIASGAKYTTGGSIPSWVLNSTLYVREIENDGDVVFSIHKTGAITGVVSKKYVTKKTTSKSTTKKTVNYKVQVTADSLNIREKANASSEKVGTITDKGIYTIVEESNGFGKLKSGAGWISLKYTKKI